jgi:hypothetical protein
MVIRHDPSPRISTSVHPAPSVRLCTPTPFPTSHERRYCSPLLTHSFRMQHQIIWCAQTAAIHNNKRRLTSSQPVAKAPHHDGALLPLPPTLPVSGVRGVADRGMRLQSNRGTVDTGRITIVRGPDMRPGIYPNNHKTVRSGCFNCHPNHRSMSLPPPHTLSRKCHLRKNRTETDIILDDYQTEKSSVPGACGGGAGGWGRRPRIGPRKGRRAPERPHEGGAWWFDDEAGVKGACHSSSRPWVSAMGGSVIVRAIRQGSVHAD